MRRDTGTDRGGGGEDADVDSGVVGGEVLGGVAATDGEGFVVIAMVVVV